MPFKLRLDPGMKEWIAVQARQNRRSMNSEIVVLLERHKAQQLGAQHG